MKIRLIIISLLLMLSFWVVDAVTIEVTEPVPGWNCSPSMEEWKRWIYSCNVPKWFTGVMNMAGEMIRYFTYITALACVLFIVINGVLYSMAWINDSLKTWAKDRITKTLIGLVILMLSWVILNVLAPWIYKWG